VVWLLMGKSVINYEDLDNVSKNNACFLTSALYFSEAVSRSKRER